MFKNKLKPLRKIPDSGGVRWHWSLPFTQKRRGEHARAARALKTRTSHSSWKFPIISIIRFCLFPGKPFGKLFVLGSYGNKTAAATKGERRETNKRSIGLYALWTAGFLTFLFFYWIASYHFFFTDSGIRKVGSMQLIWNMHQCNNASMQPPADQCNLQLTCMGGHRTCPWVN